MRVIPVAGRDSMLFNLWGCVKVAEQPGLGIEPDLERIEAAHALYRKVGSGARDDAVAIQ